MLIRTLDGQYVAYNRVCPVSSPGARCGGCLVRYYHYIPRIECPCCGSVYRYSDGAPISGPAVQLGRGLPVVRLEIEAGDIYAAGIDGMIGN